MSALLGSAALFSSLAQASPERVCVVDVRQNDQNVNQVEITLEQKPSAEGSIYAYEGVIENARLSLSLRVSAGAETLTLSAVDSSNPLRELVPQASHLFKSGESLPQVINGAYILDISCH